SPVKAAYEGTREVATPVLAATATTIAGFLPLMLMPGIIGQFLQIVPIVVSLALVASLLEAFLVLPSHVAEWSKKQVRKKPRVTRRTKIFSRLNRYYVPLVSKSIRYRYLVVTTVLLSLVAVPFILERLGVEMFRDEEFPSIIVQVRMPAASNIEETEKTLLELEGKLAAVSQDDILGYAATAGFLMTQQDWFFKASVAQIQLDLTDMDSRTISNDSLIEEMRAAFADVIGPVSIDYMKIESGPPVGAPLEVKVKGRYLGELEEVANELMDEVRDIEGLYDVRDNFELGKKEVRYKVDLESAARLGFTPESIAREMLIAFEGLEATSYRDGDQEVRVVVKFPETSRKSFDVLEGMRLTNDAGLTVALSDMTTRVEGRGIDEIRRFNQERAITIFAENDKKVIQIDKVAALVAERFKEIGKRHPGYRLDFGGEWNEFKNAFGPLSKLFAVGILLIYMILGAQFKSFLQPFIIIFTIPFAIIGAMLGLLYLGDPFSIATLYGIVALSGVVVNDALVLVDFVNRGRTRGSARYFSIVRAGKRRLRPILSTSITTIFGLLPMAIGLGGRSIVWGPLATTIVWGLTIATVLTLFVIPALYAITDDIKSRLGLRLVHIPHEI
ncbi:efflux RND transporter permease subunit, partial [bacterium AH-315-J21]|nr:efflux RND transporter permease subunit [bacterium AH-315-J21]